MSVQNEHKHPIYVRFLTTKQFPFYFGQNSLIVSDWFQKDIETYICLIKICSFESKFSIFFRWIFFPIENRSKCGQTVVWTPYSYDGCIHLNTTRSYVLVKWMNYYKHQACHSFSWLETFSTDWTYTCIWHSIYYLMHAFGQHNQISARLKVFGSCPVDSLSSIFILLQHFFLIVLWI